MSTALSGSKLGNRPILAAVIALAVIWIAPLVWVSPLLVQAERIFSVRTDVLFRRLHAEELSGHHRQFRRFGWIVNSMVVSIGQTS